MQIKKNTVFFINAKRMQVSKLGLVLTIQKLSKTLTVAGLPFKELLLSFKQLIYTIKMEL